MQGNISDVLSHYELEHLIEHINEYSIEEYGSRTYRYHQYTDRWYKQDHTLQKINIQAHVNAVMKQDQHIMESCVTFDKVKLLIYDMILSEMWKHHVLPHLLVHLTKISSLRSYVAIQHEAVVCNLLEVILYHRTAVEAADTYLLEVIDYCFRKLSSLVSSPPPKKVVKQDVQAYLNKDSKAELEEQIYSVNFQTQMMCLSIIRYISDQIRYLPIFVIHHLIVQNDFFFLIVPLIELKPWIRENSQGQREQYLNSKWTVIDQREYNKLPILEAQLWITLYNLFMSAECRKKYELNGYKKSNLLRVRKYMNDVLLDQIPNLVDMLRSLEELSLLNVAAQQSSNPFMVQQLPELRERICKNKNWKEIAKHQQDNFFVLNDESIKEDMERLAQLYSTRAFESLIEGFHCEKCGKEATKRCSRCKQVWYCSKECQLDHWKTHKALCNAQAQADKALPASKPSEPEVKKVVPVVTEAAEAKPDKVDYDDID